MGFVTKMCNGCNWRNFTKCQKCKGCNEDISGIEAGEETLVFYDLGGVEYMKKKRMRKDDDGDNGGEDNELPSKKKKKQSAGRPRKVDMIEKNTLQKHFIQPHGTTVMKKYSAEEDAYSAEEDGSRNGAGKTKFPSLPRPPSGSGRRQFRQLFI